MINKIRHELFCIKWLWKNRKWKNTRQNANGDGIRFEPENLRFVRLYQCKLFGQDIQPKKRPGIKQILRFAL